MDKDLQSQNAMFDYLRSLDEINVDQKDDLSVFEQVASVFDNQLVQYSNIAQELKRQQALADRQIYSASIDVEGLVDEIGSKEHELA
jgi:hypothetical protein